MADRRTLAAMPALLDWLEDRPELPLPQFGSWSMPPAGERYGEDGQAFHVYARSQEELDSLAHHFDEPAPAYPFHPIGLRRCFGPVAYEALLDEDWGDPCGHGEVASRPGPLRSARLVGLRELHRWLAERPSLPLPLQPWLVAGTAGEDDLIAFRARASTGREQDRMLASFDRVERWPADLPLYVKSAMRVFAGGIAYAVDVGLE